MFELKFGKKNYKVQFGINSFCDTDLMDRTKKIIRFMSENGMFDDKEKVAEEQVDEVAVIMNNLDSYKDVIITTRELLFVGFKKHNPVETIEQVGDMLDDYAENGGNLIEVFSKLVEELITKGFMADLGKQEE
jgi:hypothetical protein